MGQTRDYARIWVKGHYRNTNKIGKNGHPIRRWIKGYWKKINIKSFWDRFH